MTDAMTKLQRLGEQATLGEITYRDLYIMRHLTMTDDADMPEKKLEIQGDSKVLCTFVLPISFVY
jgi:hypothetical protein